MSVGYVKIECEWQLLFNQSHGVGPWPHSLKIWPYTIPLSCIPAVNLQLTPCLGQKLWQSLPRTKAGLLVNLKRERRCGCSCHLRELASPTKCTPRRLHLVGQQRLSNLVFFCPVTNIISNANFWVNGYVTRKPKPCRAICTGNCTDWN